jgi:hypothetical protein
MGLPIFLRVGGNRAYGAEAWSFEERHLGKVTMWAASPHKKVYLLLSTTRGVPGDLQCYEGICRLVEEIVAVAPTGWRRRSACWQAATA